MLTKISTGHKIKKEFVIEIHDKLYDKRKVKTCKNCNDYYVNFNGTPTPILKSFGDISQDVYCCSACSLEAGLVQNIFGDYQINKKLGQVDFCKHRNSTRLHKTTYEHPFLIGFEVEKEDPKYFDKLHDPSIGLKIPPGWICMKDTSLKNSGGFELVSPAYNLTKDFNLIKKHLKDYKELMKANYSQWCGGHISISKKGLPGVTFARQQKALICFFLTLFPARLRNCNVNQYNFDKCLTLDKKHKPIRVDPNGRFELRMPSAVKSSAQLLRRIKTIEWFLKNEPSFASVYFSMKNKKGILRKIYSPVYGYERWNEFIERFSKMSLWFCKGVGEDTIYNYVQRDEME